MTSNPWADPRTETEPGAPYEGPPPTLPPSAGAPYGALPYGWMPYGYPGAGLPPAWPVPPQGPRRPGQVIAAAVLTFVQAALVLGASAYLLLVVSVLGIAASEGGGAPPEIRGFAAELHVLGVIQLISAVLLIVAGVLALTRRGVLARWVLVGAFAGQVVLAVYWAVRLITAFSGVSDPSPVGTFVWLSLFFAAPPMVGLGLVLVGPGRGWFATPRAALRGAGRPG